MTAKKRGRPTIPKKQKRIKKTIFLSPDSVRMMKQLSKRYSGRSQGRIIDDCVSIVYKEINKLEKNNVNTGEWKN